MTTDAKPRFQCVPCHVLIEEAPDEDEDFERKNAYREGYIQALHDLQSLAQKGFAREQERINMLEKHAGWALKRWALDASTRNYYEAPKIDTPTWWAIRRQVFERDGKVCEFCGATEDLEIDHIQQVQHGGTSELSNLRVLCKTCNRSR